MVHLLWAEKFLVVQSQPMNTHKITQNEGMSQSCHRIVNKLPPIDNFKVVRGCTCDYVCHGDNFLVVPDDNLDNFLDDNYKAMQS